MANLIIKPTSGGSLVLQDEGGDAALTVGTTGSTTLAGTANALGTVATGNLSNNNIVMPRFKEYDRFYDATTYTSTTTEVRLNISGSNYLTVTTEHANDILEFSWSFNFRNVDGYMGFGIQRATNTGFTSGATHVWTQGEHLWGQGDHSSDMYEYDGENGSVSLLASEILPSGSIVDTTYYFRLIGYTHSATVNAVWGNTITDQIIGYGIRFEVKRWSIV